jgi:predicted membrane protein
MYETIIHLLFVVLVFLIAIVVGYFGIIILAHIAGYEWPNTKKEVILYFDWVFIISTLFGGLLSIYFGMRILKTILNATYGQYDTINYSFLCLFIIGFSLIFISMMSVINSLESVKK